MANNSSAATSASVTTLQTKEASTGATFRQESEWLHTRVATQNTILSMSKCGGETFGKKASKNQVQRGVAIEYFRNWQDVEWRGQFVVTLEHEKSSLK